MVEAIIREIEDRKKEASGERINTVYFGGGTPSVLSIELINRILEALTRQYTISGDAEISLEANPDDLTKSYLSALKKETPVNRLSIGIQAFQDTHLKLMNRRHSAGEAKQCIENSLKTGFTNLNIDLIYGIPGMRMEDWMENLQVFFDYEIPHLSAYHLTFEEKTVFDHRRKKGLLSPVAEEDSIQQYNYLLDFTGSRGYDNYEISNFAREGYYSQHNLGYWLGEKYFGFGPSAHSFTIKSRRWNIANNTRYMEALESHSASFFESEVIDKNRAFNEYLLTRLRTKWGIDRQEIRKNFGALLETQCLENLSRFLQDESCMEKDGRYVLTRKGKFISDYILSELIV